MELRLNDRDYEVGDTLQLQEWDPQRKCYTGRETHRRVIYVLSKRAGLADGYVLMGLAPA